MNIHINYDVTHTTARILFLMMLALVLIRLFEYAYNCSYNLFKVP